MRPALLRLLRVIKNRRPVHVHRCQVVNFLRQQIIPVTVGHHTVVQLVGGTRTGARRTQGDIAQVRQVTLKCTARDTEPQSAGGTDTRNGCRGPVQGAAANGRTGTTARLTGDIYRIRGI
ncbi:hypothetical protein VQZ80_001171 [Salmonella enterica]|nr:hypothetical protein [Salmonella enterica]EKC2306134.1 hypothetical protein [Salmonella enterica]EKC2385847.1 hypothetical protein [Salmonella enterica]EKC2530846.1 hypothetical protein [Salmonella enterica]EKC2984309.1 hypothetical protein [Salmonella enterica]